ncbi:hypothetical protein [Tianweitania sp.]|uniref:hypothetical protein n=1 Tax=Tianweitania sp. TaxID=2021634 RepID=UPI0028975469|nr:hypothetical protein [Tianweitania sp.]
MGSEPVARGLSGEVSLLFKSPPGGKRKPPPRGKLEDKVMNATNESAKALGYQASTVIAHIMDMDVDAGGNAEKAAWKRYLVLILMAQAKAADKKKLIEAVFGKGEKASKTFQNMWGVASNARNVVLGNRSWDDIRSMSIAEAKYAVLLAVNGHVGALEVSSKNDYAAVCMLSPSEALAKREADAEAAKEAEAEAAAKAEAAKEAKTAKEAAAKAEADARPERSPADAAIGVLHDAHRNNLMQVAGFILSKISVEDMKLMQETLRAMLTNATREVAAPLAIAA